MAREPILPPTSICRRSALAGIGAAAAIVGLGRSVTEVGAQVTASEMAGHPIVGAWNGMTPSGPVVGIFLPDGTNLITVPATQAGPNGVEFISTQAGRWEPVSERGIHFTSVQWHSDANGVYTGSVTVDGYPVVSEDGQTLLDTGTPGSVTIRDAAHQVVQVVTNPPPVTGVRMRVGTPGFPEGTSVTGTPTN
jgi:hypothetical protein